jgi:hypothetical protein
MEELGHDNLWLCEKLWVGGGTIPSAELTTRRKRGIAVCCHIYI